LILAATIDRIIEHDNLLRTAVGMPDRYQTAGTWLLCTSHNITLR